MKARVGEEKIEVYSDLQLTVPLGLQLEPGSEVEFDKITNIRGAYVGRMVLPDGHFGFVNPKLFQADGPKLNTDAEAKRDHKTARGKSLGERLIALDVTLGAKADQWGDAFLSGLVSGVVMAIARNKLEGGIGFLVGAFVYSFLILRISFTILQRLFATGLMLIIGFYWREILTWFK